MLCLKGFQGYGYDSEFIKNMTLINEKRKSEKTAVKVTNKPDDICKKCPNLKNDMCKNRNQNEKITRMDNKVLSHLNPEIEYSAIELFKKIDEIFNTREKLSQICSNCMWHEECLFYQKF